MPRASYIGLGGALPVCPLQHACAARVLCTSESPALNLLPALRSPAALSLSTRAAHSPYTPGHKRGISFAHLVFVSAGRAPRSLSGQSRLRQPLCALVPGSLTVLSALHASPTVH